MQGFFERTPPLAAGGRGEDDERRQADDQADDQADEGPVRTQMIGESPEDDLGYDPSTIPTEPIPDDEQ